MRLILFSLCSLIFTCGAGPTAHATHESQPRIYPDDARIREILNKPLALEKFRSESGYIDFAESYFNSNLHPCFVYVSRALGKRSSALGWRHFRGTVAEFRITREVLTNPDPGGAYFGRAGYIRFAIDRTSFRMQVAFENASAALGKGAFERLEWGNVYSGTALAYAAERFRVLGDNRSPLKFSGPEGYRRYADQYYAGQMQRAFANVSATVSAGEFKRLGWGKQFIGTTTEFVAERSLLFAGGRPTPEYEGVAGYQRFAVDRCAGQMIIAFKNASAVLSEEEFAQLGWGKAYHGSNISYAGERAKLFREGEPRPEYLGLAGYIKYADDHYAGQMPKCSVNVASVLGSEAQFKQLGWGAKFLGTTEEHSALRKFLFLDGPARAAARWFGKSRGLPKLVTAYLRSVGATAPYSPSIRAKYRSMFCAVVSPDELRYLGWHSVGARPKDCRAYLTSNGRAPAE